MEFIGNRISYLRKEDEFSIVISAAPNKKQGYYWMIWSLLWTLCGIAVLFSFQDIQARDQRIVLIVFLSFWAYFEWKSLKMFLWKWKGREVIRIRPDGLLAGKRTFGKGKVLLFTWEGLQEMKKNVTDKSAPLNILRSVDLFAGTPAITYIYFGKEYGLGIELHESDASKLFSLMTKEIRRYKAD